MSAILNRIRRNSHQKLCEDWNGSQEPVSEGVTFYVKYLGSVLVDRSSGEDVTNQAIKTIITMAKKQDRKLTRVSLTIALKGIKMVEVSSSEIVLEVSIYRISYCSADATYDHVFAFISTNSNDTLECHAFLCPKRKMAQAATLTIAQAFNLAYECWQAAQERKRRRKGKSESRNRREDSKGRREDSKGRREESKGRSEESKGRREGSREGRSGKNKKTDESGDKPVTVAIVESYMRKTSLDEKINEKTTSPSSGYNSCTSGQEDETLLIDLSSPGDELGTKNTSIAETMQIMDCNLLEHYREPDSEGAKDNADSEGAKDTADSEGAKDTADWVRFEDEEIMNRTFSMLADERSPAMLRKLPASVVGLEFGALAGSPGSYDSPYGSPLHGSNLTHSQLITPVGSPMHTALGSSLNYGGSPPTSRFSAPPLATGGCLNQRSSCHGSPGTGISIPGSPARYSTSPVIRNYGLDTYSNSGVFSSPRSPAIPSPLVSSPQPSTQSYLSTSPALLSPMLSARTPPPPPVSQPLSQSYLSTSPPLLSPMLSARTPPPPPVSQPLSQSYLSTSPPLLSPMLSARTPPPPPPVHMSLGSPPRISSPTVITSRPTHSKGSQPEQTK